MIADAYGPLLGQERIRELLTELGRRCAGAQGERSSRRGAFGRVPSVVRVVTPGSPRTSSDRRYRYRRVDPVVQSLGRHSTTESPTSMLPRVALEYGHTLCAASTNDCAVARSSLGA